MFLQSHGNYFRDSTLAVVSFLSKSCKTANNYLLASSSTIVFLPGFRIVMSYGKSSWPSQEGGHSVCIVVLNSETVRLCLWQYKTFILLARCNL